MLSVPVSSSIEKIKPTSQLLWNLNKVPVCIVNINFFLKLAFFNHISEPLQYMPNHHWDTYDTEMPLPSGGELYQTTYLVCSPQTLLPIQAADKCGSPSRNLTSWSPLPGFLRTCSFHTRPSLLVSSQVSHFSFQSCCLPSCCSLPPNKDQAINLFSSDVPSRVTPFLSQPWFIRRVWALTDARASAWWLSSFVFLV